MLLCSCIVVTKRHAALKFRLTITQNAIQFQKPGALISQPDSSCSRLQEPWDTVKFNTLWRVQPDVKPLECLEPRGSPRFDDPADFEQQRQRHLNWDFNFQSPFVSCFSDKEHAIHWGNQVHPDGILYEIRASELDVHRGRQKDEYLIVGKVTSNYIRRASNVQDELCELMAIKEERKPDRRYRPGREWYANLGGYYSDENEANEDNDMNEYAEYMMDHL